MPASPRRVSRRRHAALLCGLALAAGAAGCSERSEARSGEADAARAVPVRAIQPQRRALRDTIDLTTTATADVAVDVFAKTTGRCTAVHVEAGDAVAPGTLLVELDEEEAHLTERQAFVRLSKARQDLARAESMRAQALVSAENYQAAKLAEEEAEAAWALAKLALEDTRITAPVGGTVAQRSVSVGDFVTPSLPLLRIVDFTTLEARVHVPEQALPRIRVGLPVDVTADALPGAVIDTTVTRISPVVDPASGTVEVTVGLPADSGLRPGMFVRVSLVTDQRADAVVVPAEALVAEAGGYAVYVVRDGRADRVPVTVGLRDGGWAEIVSGLAPDATVVTEGLFRLEPGSRVRVVDAAE